MHNNCSGIEKGCPILTQIWSNRVETNNLHHICPGTNTTLKMNNRFINRHDKVLQKCMVNFVSLRDRILQEIDAINGAGL